ncbi:MAG: hypothetical protein ACO1SV_23160 [Fimbriimonas sp.]
MPFPIALFFSNSVDLEHRVARLPTVVAELATEGNLRLMVSAELANEIVYIRAKPREAQVWMRLIAEATCGEWAEDGATWRLTRSPALRRRLEEAERIERGVQLERSVRRFLGSPNLAVATPAELQKLTSKSAAAAEAARSTLASDENRLAVYDRLREIEGEFLPKQRFLRRFLTLEVLAMVAEVPAGQVDYRSSQPKRFRRPIPNPTSALAKYGQEREALVSVIAAQRGERSFSDVAMRISNELFLADSGPRPVSVNLRIERLETDQTGVAVDLVGAHGWLVEQAVAILPLIPLPSAWPNFSGLSNLSLEITPRIADLRVLATGMEMDGLMSLAADPVRNEPGELFTRPLLDALCEKDDTQAIIGLDDSLIPALLGTLIGEPHLGTLIERLEISTVLRASEGLVVGSPRYPVEATKMRLDRGLLRDLVAKIGRRGGYRLDVLAEYAAKQNPDAGVSRLDQLVVRTAGAGVPMMNGALTSLFDTRYGGRETLRMYGLLPSALRRALWEGTAVPVASLPMAAQTSLARRIFRNEVFFRPNPGYRHWSHQDAPGWLPDGIPVDAYLRAEAVSVPAATAANRAFAPVPLMMEAVGFSIYQQETKNPVYGFEKLPEVRQSLQWPLRYGTLTINFQFAPNIGFETKLVDIVPLSERAVPYSQLPEGHRKIAEEIVDAMRKRSSQTTNAPPPSQ